MNRRTATALVLAAASAFLLRASNMSISTIMPFLARYELRFHAIYLGALATAFMGSAFAAGMLNAVLGNRCRRVSSLIAAAALAASFLLFYTSNSYTVWAAAVVGGISTGFLMPNVMTAAGAGEGATAERGVAIYSIGLSASLVLAPSLDSAATLGFGIRGAFLVLEPLGALAALITGAFVLKSLKGTGRPSRVKGILASHGFMFSLINAVAYQLVYALVATFGGIMGEEVYGLGASSAMLVFVAFFSTSLASRTIIAVKPPKGLMEPTVLSLSLTVTGLTLIGLVHGLVPFVLGMAILGVPHGITYTSSLIMLVRAFPMEKRAAANSFFQSMFMLIGAFLPSVAGFEVALLGYFGAFLLSALTSAVLFIAAYQEYRIAVISVGAH